MQAVLFEMLMIRISLQEWPICVSYGAIVGYFIGMVASLGFIIVHKFQQHVKGD